MHELLRWHVPRIGGGIELRELRSRHVLGIGRVSVHELQRGDVPSEHGLVELHELRGGHVFVVGRGDISVDVQQLCCRLLFCGCGVSVQQLRGGQIPGLDRCDGVRELRGGPVLGCGR